MDQTIDRTMNKVTDKLNGAAREAKDFEIPAAVTEQIETLKKQSKLALDRTEVLVKQHPFYAVLGAAAVGAIVASLITNIISNRSNKY